jgi:HPt (histidine-containing phosphotransfer) domain-containing protein
MNVMADQDKLRSTICSSDGYEPEFHACPIFPDMSVIVDREQLIDATGGDHEFEIELLDEYIECTNDLLGQLSSDIRSEISPATTRAAHTLKGSSRTLGFTRMATLCEQLEASLNQQRLDSAKDMVDLIAGEFALAKRWIATNKFAAAA